MRNGETSHLLTLLHRLNSSIHTLSFQKLARTHSPLTPQMQPTLYPLPHRHPAAPELLQNPNRNLEHARIPLQGIHLFPWHYVRIHGILINTYGPRRLAEAPGPGTDICLSVRRTFLNRSSAFTQQFRACIPSGCHVRHIFLPYTY